MPHAPDPNIARHQYLKPLLCLPMVHALSDNMCEDALLRVVVLIRYKTPVCVIYPEF
jgi:hypothetical protein